MLNSRCWRFHPKATQVQGRAASAQLLQRQIKGPSSSSVREQEEATFGPDCQEGHVRAEISTGRVCNGTTLSQVLVSSNFWIEVINTWYDAGPSFQVLNASSSELSHYFQYLFKFILLAYAVLCLKDLLRRWSNGSFLSLWCAWDPSTYQQAFVFFSLLDRGVARPRSVFHQLSHC